MSDPMKSLLRDGQGHWGGLLSSHAVNTHTLTHTPSFSCSLSRFLSHSATQTHTHIHTHTHTHTHTNTHTLPTSALWGCHISQYPVAWGELWPCHSIEGECVVCLCGHTFTWACVCAVCVFACISNPLCVRLFIKDLLTPNQWCPEFHCMCKWQNDL